MGSAGDRAARGVADDVLRYLARTEEAERLGDISVAHVFAVVTVVVEVLERLGRLSPPADELVILDIVGDPFTVAGGPHRPDHRPQETTADGR